ncbi:uncharacterized protein LOC143203402 [Rhynchophorus ferrugineus]|uniref:uncharacterized protein LOC143203402 n=1 Tax=Rhynchophorus ferrugineus TaxID=354439 RepID=UPI003FCD71ED
MMKESLPGLMEVIASHRILAGGEPNYFIFKNQKYGYSSNPPGFNQFHTRAALGCLSNYSFIILSTPSMQSPHPYSKVILTDGSGAPIGLDAPIHFCSPEVILFRHQYAIFRWIKPEYSVGGRYTRHVLGESTFSADCQHGSVSEKPENYWIDPVQFAVSFKLILRRHARETTQELAILHSSTSVINEGIQRNNTPALTRTPNVDRRAG